MADLYQRLKQFKQNNHSAGNPSTQFQNENKQEQANGSESPPKTEPLSSKHANQNSLINIPGVMRGRELINAIQKRDTEKNQFLQSIGVEIRENAQGKFGFKEIFYPATTLPYQSCDITSAEVARHVQADEPCPLEGKHILFIDTETTGLAGGTGTVPFLIGVGFFTDTGFTVQQFLMRDYDDEPAVLEELNNLCNNFSAVSTYNGKNFDVPLLNSRYLLNRRRTPLTSLPHFDLLYPARRFWRDTLPNCRLSTVESSIFGHSREEDIPGELIPYVYFDFIRGIRMHRMSPVLSHNAEDIRSLAMIAAKICRMLKNPEIECQTAFEMLAIGKYFMAEDEVNTASTYFQQALDHKDLPDESRYLIQRKLSLIYKRNNQYQLAVDIWKEMLNTSADSFACIELAKWYEHKKKQWHNALKYTQLALELAQGNSVSTLTTETLIYRQNRLLRKINRSTHQVQSNRT